MIPHGDFYADKIMDLANLGAAALIFGQITEGHIHWMGFLAGIIWLVFCFVVSYLLS